MKIHKILHSALDVRMNTDTRFVKIKMILRMISLLIISNVCYFVMIKILWINRMVIQLKETL
ncbi:hypothetical protein AVR67_05285 [Escherichia coli]|nr:hypothetical protein AVR67_05285 [Escherichia coli]AML13672.1 hypothetical protein AVR72_04910 [Escherichia coli]KUU54001.1 hypothetical protein AWF24_16360 [Escherichia coli]OAY12365.1 hypothetical protein A9Y77_15235 [Escherichia coli]OOI36663.1 hypothetical protein BMT86_06280 [Escherichia coli]